VQARLQPPQWAGSELTSTQSVPQRENPAGQSPWVHNPSGVQVWPAGQGPQVMLVPQPLSQLPHCLERLSQVWGLQLPSHRQVCWLQVCPVAAQVSGQVPSQPSEPQHRPVHWGTQSQGVLHPE
jgi:hypothetical protein